MANIKTRSRVKSSKTTKNVSVRKGKKTPDISKQKDAEHEKSIINNMDSTDKVAFLLQNGKLFKDKLQLRTPTVNGKINKNALNITKSQLMSKNGLIKKKSKENLSLIDDILKSELMINTNVSTKKLRQREPAAATETINNNSDQVSDQNVNDQPSSTQSTPEKLDKNSNRIRKTKKDQVKTNLSKQLEPKKTRKNSKAAQKKASNNNSCKEPSKTKQVTLSNGVVLTLSLYQCDYCQKTFSHKSSLRRHIYVHLKIKPYACTYCPKKFSQKTNLTAHVSGVHVKELPSSHICNQCDKVFLLQENLLLHLSTHVKNENEFRCLFCDKRFSHQILLTKHEKQHLVAGKFQCSICKMSYDCRSRLSTHVKSHLNIKEYICQYCGKEFLRPSSIRRHLEISHGGYSIQCPICNKKLKGHLTEHMRLHEKKRPHECPECGQRFTQSTQLTVHRRSHTGVKPYSCRICSRQFSHSNALMLHVRRHTGEKPFPCAMCHFAFSQLPHMKAHMKNIHGKLLPYKCKKCNNFFKLKVDLDEHMKTCTVGDKELSFEEQIQASVQVVEEESTMNISRMRFLLALLLTMIASQPRLMILGFNKRLIDDILVESLEAMGEQPVVDQTMSPFARLKANIQTLLNETVPKEQMMKFREENKSTEELLELLTGDKYKHKKR